MISNSNYKNKKSVKLENKRLIVEILPEYGGKIVSLKDKEKNYEFLVQRPGEVYQEPSYDGVYIDSECSGFDDMFPNIDEEYYEAYPWAGIRMPDHGEVYSVKWQHQIENDVLSMQVNGVRFPYLLKKDIRFTEDNTLRIEYILVNKSEFDFFFLWAAHIMVNMEEGTELILPAAAKEAVTVISKSGRIGSYGNCFKWPAFYDSHNKKHSANIVRPADVEDFEKYYFKDALKEGWCTLKYPNNKIFSLSFPQETVPYLGILMNENGWNNNKVWDKLYNIFIEPCTSSFDRVDIAKMHNQCSVLKANSEYKWYLNISSR